MRNRGEATKRPVIGCGSCGRGDDEVDRRMIGAGYAGRYERGVWKIE